MNATTARRLNIAGLVITLLTVICAVLWAFPLYWGVVSSLKPENEVVRPYIELWPDTLTFSHYVFALTQTEIGEALGITRQAAQKRYGDVGGTRTAGGQKGGWR